MLRRTHDHYRDFRARRHARASADSSNQRNQVRYFMSQPKPQARKCAHLLRWLSAGRGSTRSNRHAAGQLQFFGQHSHLAERAAFTVFMAPLRKIRWYVYGKRPFAGPEAVLTYLSRYTHRVAIANSRLIAFNKNTVSFKYKDYRVE